MNHNIKHLLTMTGGHQNGCDYVKMEANGRLFIVHGC